MADRADRRAIARAHARRTHDPYLASEFSREIADEMLGAAHGARQ